MTIELPLIAEPPFWRAVEPHEYALLFNPDAPPMPADALDIGPGWTLSFFSFAIPEKERVANWGWVKGEFAIDERYCAFDDIDKHVYCAVLTYLPNGYRIGIYNLCEDAKLAAAILAREVDWSDRSPQALLAQGRRARQAMEAHFDKRDDLLPYCVWRARFDGEIVRAHG